MLWYSSSAISFLRAVVLVYCAATPVCMLNIPLYCVISLPGVNSWKTDDAVSSLLVRCSLLLVCNLSVSCCRHSLQPSLHSESPSHYQGGVLEQFWHFILQRWSPLDITPCKGAWDSVKELLLLFQRWGGTYRTTRQDLWILHFQRL